MTTMQRQTQRLLLFGSFDCRFGEERATRLPCNALIFSARSTFIARRHSLFILLVPPFFRPSLLMPRAASKRFLFFADPFFFATLGKANRRRKSHLTNEAAAAHFHFDQIHCHIASVSVTLDRSWAECTQTAETHPVPNRHENQM